jgi:alginate O-acetyltransferase complex protein AlgI
MVFSSSFFLTMFLPIFLLLYFCIPRRLPKIKNLIILLASIFFYAWGAPKFIFALLLTTTVDFFFVKWMDACTLKSRKVKYLIASLSLNLGLLAYFKYSNFFIENVNALFAENGNNVIEWTKVILPIGISFYTFETITYVVDVYRKVHKPLKNFWDYQLYILLFPKLIAGPIVRFHSIADQISVRNESSNQRLQGFVRFCIGLGKKILIANVVGEIADAMFILENDQLTFAKAWVGLIAYSFQIYFDFSGYSDMALGIGLMIGFKFPENFNNPYTARSVTEFWRRWHISLGDWMRNYLYIPLGGNKVDTKFRLFFNLWFVFIVSGFWHGASWNFIIWGAFHGIFLILDRLFLIKVMNAIGVIPSVILTFLLISTAWTFFRLENFSDAVHYIKKLYTFDNLQQSIGVSNEFIFMLFFGIGIVLFNLTKSGKYLEKVIYPGEKKWFWYFPAALCSLLVFFLCLASIGNSNFNPFIYFRF